MPSSNYADSAWKKTRLQILQRDGYRCQIKGHKCKGRATEVDHIVNVDDGGARLDWSNLRAACKSCNVGKRNRELAAVAREARGQAPRVSTPRGITRSPNFNHKRTTKYGHWDLTYGWEPGSAMFHPECADDGWEPDDAA